MMKSAGHLTRLSSTISISLAVAGCLGDGTPVVASVNTMCVSTSRYHATAEQKAVLVADRITIEKGGVTGSVGSGEAVFGALVRWLAGFNRVRDEECLKPNAF